MANSVQGGNHNIRGCYLVGLYFNLGHLALPGLPLTRDAHLQIQSKRHNSHLTAVVFFGLFFFFFYSRQCSITVTKKLYLVVDDGDIRCSREGHSGDATDVLSQLSPYLQPPVTREGPQHSVDQIFL